jgi:hypothetical protein
LPLEWAMTQNNLGLALWRLGERERGTDRLEEAVLAYREALKEFTRERLPLDWAMRRVLQAVCEYPGAAASVYHPTLPRLFPDKEIEYRRLQDEWQERLFKVWQHPARSRQNRALATELLGDERLTADDIGARLIEAYLMQVSREAHVS